MEWYLDRVEQALGESSRSYRPPFRLVATIETPREVDPVSAYATVIVGYAKIFEQLARYEHSFLDTCIKVARALKDTLRTETRSQKWREHC